LGLVGKLGDPGCCGRTSSCRTTPASRFETPRISSAHSGSGRRSCGGTFDLEAKGKRIEELERLAADPTFWEDQDRARTLLQEKSELERDVRFFDETRASIEEAEVLLELSREEEDAETGREAAERVEALERRLEEAELRRLLSGEHDASSAIVSINAGAGGTEACDWAEMLLRMYLRWAEERGYRTRILDIQEGEEAGIKSVTFTVEGELAYGYMKSEIGIHRLVRLSPFDAQHRRHTSFASFTMYPEIPSDVEVEVDEKDLRIDTYRASGAGGQHVNRTDSAVRITHIPSGIVVQCQNERSQHKNRALAMKVLRARLYEAAREAHEAEKERLVGEKKRIDFGSQIRSYTLHPSQRVKDHRTGLEIGNAQGVLDGAIDDLIRAYLLKRAES
jgi:peptide chain release factor 2